MIFLTAGAGVHVIDGRRYAVGPPVLFVVRKDQVHCWELSTPGEGYVLIIRREFVEGLTDGRLRSLIASVSAYSCVPLTGNASVDRLWTVLLDETDGAPEIVETVLTALLAKMMSLAGPAVKPIRESGGLYEQYLHLLENGHAMKRTVEHYASLLHTTPQNLNNACRKAADRAAAGVLGDFLMGEAKRLLLYTSGTVAEISFSLDFKDPSHFIKYFKRATGLTPQAFRKMPDFFQIDHQG
jgi:AraC-like DNA-binding protein